MTKAHQLHVSRFQLYHCCIQQGEGLDDVLQKNQFNINHTWKIGSIVALENNESSGLDTFSFTNIKYKLE